MLGKITQKQTKNLKYFLSGRIFTPWIRIRMGSGIRIRFTTYTHYTDRHHLIKKDIQRCKKLRRGCVSKCFEGGGGISLRKCAVGAVAFHRQKKCNILRQFHLIIYLKNFFISCIKCFVLFKNWGQMV